MNMHAAGSTETTAGAAESSSPKEVGQPLTRIDGRLKVTGKAKYAAEFAQPRMAYACMVRSTIAKGNVASMETARAEHSAGVLAVMTPMNAPKLAALRTDAPTSPAGRNLSLLQSPGVFYNGQPIALVVAETLDQAWYAASLIKAKYYAEHPQLDFHDGFPTAYPPKRSRDAGIVKRGDADAGVAKSDVKVDATYSTPKQFHNPMETHATVASWDGDKLTLWDATQNISGDKATVARILSIPEENVHTICPYVGGGFGSKGSTWSHVVLAAMAARQINRPVQLSLERPQMFGPVGGRPQTEQHVTLAATRNGKLTAIKHECYSHTSFIEDFLEPSAAQTEMLYDCPALLTSQKLVQLNVGTPTYQRAPGEATGTFALESAMDELAHKLKMDPIALRLANYAEVDPQDSRPFTGKHLRECYAQGAEKFGWAKRNPEPRSMKHGRLLVGWGMATATYKANRSGASCLARLQPDGRALVASGTQELGTGMYTIMAQVASDSLGLLPSMIDVQLGDSTLPRAPVSGGSQSSASVMPAVKEACEQAKVKLFAMAIGDARSPLHGSAPEQLDFKSGKVFLKSNTSKGEAFTALLARNGNIPLEVTGHAQPGEEIRGMSPHSFGAVFAEVTVDPDLGIVRVRKVVGVYDIGTLLNSKTGKSQLIGGIVWGIGTVLLEAGHVDTRNGRVVNANLAEYHVPVNADIGEIDVSVVGIPDMNLNSLGARGIGEIGITGAAAAVANAIYHATGKRVRDLPITPDKLMA